MPLDRPPEGDARHARPGMLVLACGVLGLEALALAVYALLSVVAGLRGATEGGAGLTVGVVVFCGGIAGVLVAAATALWRGRRWGRGPALTWQLLQLAVGLSILSGGRQPVAAAVVLASAVVAVGLLTPAAVAWTRGAGGPDRTV